MERKRGEVADRLQTTQDLYQQSLFLFFCLLSRSQNSVFKSLLLLIQMQLLFVTIIRKIKLRNQQTSGKHWLKWNIYINARVISFILSVVPSNDEYLMSCYLQIIFEIFFTMNPANSLLMIHCLLCTAHFDVYFSDGKMPNTASSAKTHNCVAIKLM